MAATIRPRKLKTKTLAPVRASAAVRAEYHRRLTAQVEAMERSLLWWMRAAYRANQPATMAQDRSAADVLNAIMRKLARRWMQRFDAFANRTGEWFTAAASRGADSSMQARLKAAGMTVRFQTTPAQQDAVQAVLAENVGLIKSIASRHLEQVQGAVMRCAATGRDLKTLTDEIEQIGGVSRRRAAFIATDQSNKASAIIVKTRQQELGITHATWQHSLGGRVPRVSHLAFNGKSYEIDKGAYLDGKWVWPGTEPRCRCVSRSIIPGLERNT